MNVVYGAIMFFLRIYSLAWSSLALIALLADFDGHPKNSLDAVDRAFSVTLCLFLIFSFLFGGWNNRIVPMISWLSITAILVKRVLINPFGRKGYGTDFWVILSAGSIPVSLGLGIIFSTMI